MFIPESVRFARDFAAFGQRFGIRPEDLALMIVHAERAATSQARGRLAVRDRHAGEVAKLAEKYGLRVVWFTPGWPSFEKRATGGPPVWGALPRRGVPLIG